MLMGSSTIQSVSFGVTVENISFISNTSIEVVLGNRASGSVQAKIVSNTGSFVESNASTLFTYLEPNAIASISPARGRQGTRVTIQGARLLGGGSHVEHVLIGGDKAKLVGNNASNEKVIIDILKTGIPNSPVDVTVVSDTGARSILVGGWNPISDGNITSIIPNEGSYGTILQINGTELLGLGSKIISVTLGGYEVLEIIENSSNSSISVAAGNGVAGVGDVVIKSDTGAEVVIVDGWTYLTPASISSVSPTSGQAGTRVDIVGVGLLGGSKGVPKVYLSGVEAQTILNFSETSISVVAGALNVTKSGNVTIVASSGATVNLPGNWSYVVPGNIARIVPASGVGGTRITIQGANLYGGGSEIETVYLGNVKAEILFENASFVIVEAGISSNGIVDVMVVANTGAAVALENGFEYLASGNISSISPITGQENTIVTIRGTRLLSDGDTLLAATLAGVKAKITFYNETQVILVAGASTARTGHVILISETGGKVIAENGFTYGTKGSIVHITPLLGTQGTEVSLYGTSLFGHGTQIVSVTLSGVQASIEKQDDNFVRVVAGAGSSQTGPVMLTADSGATILATQNWTYIQQPNVTVVNPFHWAGRNHCHNHGYQFKPWQR
eukprot:m.181821 g.181821  ORF g.181821 m.181821 type:complete len:619 (+) comp15520_c0_seq1:3-1859(+)